DFATGNMQCGVDFLLQFFHLQYHLYVGDTVEVALQSGEFVVDIIAQGVGHYQLVSTDVDLHTVFSFLPRGWRRPRACSRNTVAWATCADMDRCRSCASLSPKSLLHQSLAFTGRCDPHGFAVLGYRAPGDLNTLCFQ